MDSKNYFKTFRKSTPILTKKQKLLIIFYKNGINDFLTNK